MNGSLPVFTTLVGWIWAGQRSRPSQIAGIGLILIGVVLVGYDGIVSSGSSATLLGDFLFLSAIILFAVFMVANEVWQITRGQVPFSVTLVSAATYTPIWMLHLESNLTSAPMR
jgi:drug/metabolite transporter (DMT)-like permease